MSDVMYDRPGRVAPVIEIPARTLLSDWDHSLPAAPRAASVAGNP
jgi:hypothetical protein